MVAYPKIMGIIVAAFVAGAFVSSPELRAYAANTVFSTDIVDGEVKTADLAANAVTAAKIKDNEVKGPEIAANSVGASEIIGVTKLIFATCSVTNSNSIAAQNAFTASCSVPGAAIGDRVMVENNDGFPLCFEITRAFVFPADSVALAIKNDCNTGVSTPGTGNISVIVFHT